MVRTGLAVVLLVSLVAGSALADWEKDEYAKYVQLPDLSIDGLDVNATCPKVLADDFPCNQTGAVRDFHIWGSWRQDEKPDPVRLKFWVGFYTNNPGQPPDVPSHPETLLWDCVFEPYDAAAPAPPCCYFTERRVADVDEGWWDPNTDMYVVPDHKGVWQYNFHVAPGCDPFYQKGSPDEHVTYWLALCANVPTDVDGEPLFWFGWKTSDIQWMDDAVFGHQLASAPITDWQELRHPETTESLDLAFVIVPEPATVMLLALGGLVLARRRKT